jgi:predicted ATPase
VSTQIERLDVLKAYGGKSLHEQSHGEAFLTLARERFGPEGLYLLDEPEAALSPRRQMSFLSRMHVLVGQGSQFIVATHSPILLAYPAASIHLFSAEGMTPTAYEDTEHFGLTRDFLVNRERYLKELLATDEEEQGDAD